jgi:hypothetical protein
MYGLCLFITIAVLFLFTSAFSAIIYVPADYPSIQAGINAALEGDTVLIADSTYYENINFKGKALTVASYFLVNSDTSHISNTIINGSQPNHPDSGSVVFFVSGEDTNSVLCGFTITGGTGTQYYDSNWSQYALAGGGIFILNGGAHILQNKILNNALSSSTLRANGGGISVLPWGGMYYTVIEQNLIQSNTINNTGNNLALGGGIRCCSNGRIVENVITENMVYCSNAPSLGGGISCKADTLNRNFVRIEANIISHNQALSDYTHGGYGGGVELVGTNIRLWNNDISYNIVNGAGYCYAPGVRMLFLTSPSIIDSNTFSFNHLQGNSACLGGGLLVWHCRDITIVGNRFENNEGKMGGGITNFESRNTLITDHNEFIGNSANFGAGIVDRNSISTSVAGNIFRGNSAASAGGAIQVWDANPCITNNLVIRNSTLMCGGGLSFYNSANEKVSSKYRFPTEVFCPADGVTEYNSDKVYKFFSTTGIRNTLQNRRTEVINNTIVDNQAVLGGGIYNELDSIVVMNTILWEDSAISGAEMYVDGGTVDVIHSNIDSLLVFGTMNSFLHNINSDPLFSDSLFHLSDPSRCIGAGIDSFEIGGSWYSCPPYDLYGNPRPDPSSSLPDIGACESPRDAPVVSIEKQLSGMLPKSYSLKQNYPNPFNPSTTIEFALTNSGFVTLKIFNILGEEVATLVKERLGAGKYKYKWDATGLSSGVYLYQLQTEGGYVHTRKLLLVR